MVTDYYQILQKLWRHRPKTVEEALMNCGFGLKHLGSGSYRDVYQIINATHPLVLKFPRTKWTKEDCPNGDVDVDWYPTHVAHARTEYNVINQINFTEEEAVKVLIPHMPTIHWFDYQHGVMLMEFYRPTGSEHAVEIRHVRSKVKKALNRTGDVWPSNTGVDSRNNVIILDLGMVYEQKAEENERPVPAADVPHNIDPLRRT